MMAYKHIYTINKIYESGGKKYRSPASDGALEYCIDIVRKQRRGERTCQILSAAISERREDFARIIFIGHIIAATALIYFVYV